MARRTARRRCVHVLSDGRRCPRSAYHGSTCTRHQPVPVDVLSVLERLSGVTGKAAT